MNQVIVITLLAFGFASSAQASMRVFNQSGTNLGNYTDMKVIGGLTVAAVSGKAQITKVGALENKITNIGQAAVTLVSSQCGSTVSNDSTAVYTLPLASSAQGCRFTFVVGTGVANLTYVHVNPNTADTILLLANAAGDAISADATGESVVLEAVSPVIWAPIGSEKGTWTDVN